MRNLLATAPVLHADETPGRATGSLAYVHVACTEYLTLMHVGDRSAASIDAGGVLGQFTGVLVRDGYAGYAHLQAAHAWCGAHLLRDLRSISDADPDGQLWAQAMANTLLEANRAAHEARDRGADRLDEATLKQIRNHYLGCPIGPDGPVTATVTPEYRFSIPTQSISVWMGLWKLGPPRDFIGQPSTPTGQLGKL